MLRAVGAPAAVTLLVALALGIVAGSTGGSGAALGVLVGAALVCGFFASGSLVLNVVARLAPAMSLLVALLTYVLQVAVLALVLLGLHRSGALDGGVDARWLGATVVVGTLAWTALQIAVHVRTREPLYDLPAASDRPEASAR